MNDISKDLHSQPFTYRFGDTFDEFIQVLIDQFTLTRDGNGKCLKFNIDNNKLSIRNPKARHQLNEYIVSSNRDETKSILEQLEKFESDENLLSYKFDCSHNPFRYANGGVLPIIRIGTTNYFCLFYRAIFPVGWNIANGAANDIDDIRNPSRIINREFSEEFIIADHEEGILYIFDAHNDETMKGTQEQALSLWNERITEYDICKYRRKPIPLKWIEGDDSLVINYGKEHHSHDGFFVNITPDDNAIEVDKVALINLMGRFSFYDGEVEFTKDEDGRLKGHVLNRPIGFFEVEKFKKNLEGNKFEPDFFHYSGKEHPREKFNSILANEYFPDHFANKIRTAKQHKTYEDAVKDKVNLDLCPITKSLVKKYKNWNDVKDISNTTDQERIEVDKASGELLEDADVFISFKSKDQTLAELLYDFLRNKGYSVFCSSRSIKLLGDSAYIDAITKALGESRILVVIGSDLDSFDSGWVQFEWSTFLMLLNSRQKKGEIFTLTQDIDPHDLPLALQSRQNIRITDYSLEVSFNNFFGYIKNKYPPKRQPLNPE